MLVLHGSYVAQQFLIHLLNILLGNRQIIRFHVLPFLGLADAAYIHLVGALEQGNVRLHVNIIHGFKLSHAGRTQVPDLGINGPCLILKHQIAVLLAALCQCNLLVLAQVHIRNVHAFPEGVNVFHFYFLVFLICLVLHCISLNDYIK